MPQPPRVTAVFPGTVASVANAATYDIASVIVPSSPPAHSLVVAVFTREADATDVDITGVAFKAGGGDEAFTQNGSGAQRNGIHETDIWFLEAPSVESATVEVTFAHTVGDGIVLAWAAVAVISGADTSSFEDAAAVGTVTDDSTPPLSVTSSVPNTLCLGAFTTTSVATISGPGLLAAEALNTRGAALLAVPFGNAMAQSISAIGSVGDDTEDWAVCAMTITPAATHTRIRSRSRTRRQPALRA